MCNQFAQRGTTLMHVLILLKCSSIQDYIRKKAFHSLLTTRYILFVEHVEVWNTNSILNNCLEKIFRINFR